MRRTIILSLLAVLASLTTVSAQTVTAPTPATAPLKYDFPQFWHETGGFCTTIADWDSKDWLNVGLVGVGTLFALQADLTVRKEVLSTNGKYFNAMEPGRMYGEIYSPPIFFSVFAGYSLIANDMKARKIAFEIGQASLYAAAIVYVAKVAVGRSRPDVSDSSTSFSPFKIFSIVDDYHSFPSGHTTVAFVLSTVLSRNIQPLWGKILAYVPAFYTAASRVYQNFHWTSDVFAGAFLGYFVAKWAVDLHENGGLKSNDKTSLNQPSYEISSLFPLTLSVPIY